MKRLFKKDWFKVFIIVAVFCLCQYYAYTQRGYYAVGGEIFVLVVPLSFYIGNKIAMRCAREKSKVVRKCGKKSSLW